MLTPRIFVGAERLPDVGGDYALSDAAVRHVSHALRMRAGDRLALFTGAGGEYAATIVDIARRAVVVRVDAHDPVEREAPMPVVLVQSIVAVDMMDLIVRKAAELGAAAIVPVQSARTQRVPDSRLVHRVTHWRQIVSAACEQCGRNRIPVVSPVAVLAEWVAARAGSGPMAVLDGAATRSLAAFASAVVPRFVIVGPEGGFDDAELGQLRDAGAVAVHVGARTLRAETAALVALATVNAVVGDAR